MTQASLFEVVLPPELKGTRLRVASVLLDHRGKGLIRAKDIGARVGLKNDSDVVNVISELIDVYKLQIVGDRTRRTGGYKFADSIDEFIEAQIPNLAQAVTTFERVKARIGERRFREILIKMGVREKLALERDASLAAGREA